MSKQVKRPMPVRGMDVMSDETSIPADCVRLAENITFNRGGNYMSRPGFSRVVPAAGFHSLFVAKRRGLVFCTQGAEVTLINPADYTTLPIFDLQTTGPVDYVEHNGDVYFSNNDNIGMLRNGEWVGRRVGYDKPIAPQVEFFVGGTLTPGTYALVMTTVDTYGEESPASDVVTITLTETGGIKLTNLLVDFTVFNRVYMTTPDGDIFYIVEESVALYDNLIVQSNVKGAVCATQFLAPMHAGSFIRWFNSRLITASGDTLFFSEAMRPHLYTPAHGWVKFVGDISIVEPVVDGIYVGDSRGIWFLSGGDTSKFEMHLVTPTRAVAKSSTAVASDHFPTLKLQANTLIAVWLSPLGYTAGLPGGSVMDMQADRMRVKGGLTGKTAFITNNGIRQLITPVNTNDASAPGVSKDSVLAGDRGFGIFGIF